MKPNHTPEQIDLMLRAVERAKREPESFNMDHWAKSSPCGKTCCLAGNICLEAGYALDSYFLDVIKNGERESIAIVALRLIGLDQDAARPLFYLGFWPQQFQDAYEDPATPLNRALALEARVHHYLETGE